MRIIDADKLYKDVQKNMSYEMSKAMGIINNQPTIEPQDSEKIYALSVLASVLRQANYMVTLEDGSQKLCVDTAVIDEAIDNIASGLESAEVNPYLEL